MSWIAAGSWSAPNSPSSWQSYAIRLNSEPIASNRSPESFNGPVEVGARETGLPERSDEPLLLVVGDVRQVPHRGGHELRVLRHQHLRREGLEEVQEPAPRGLQRLQRAGLPG